MACPTAGYMRQVGAMNKMTFPNACQVMRWHFHPMGFEGSMDAPSSMVARLFDRSSGETLLTIAGLPCAAVMNAADVERIIEAVEAELEAFIPPQALKAG
jgi:hypothetical protein